MSSATLSPEGGVARGGGGGKGMPPASPSSNTPHSLLEDLGSTCSRVKSSTAPHDGDRLSRITSPPAETSLSKGLPLPCVLISTSPSIMAVSMHATQLVSSCTANACT
eukprot:6482971-Amphidinium_carterae.1